ncbi:MAG: hypothetical protein AAFZ65_01460 [Planctomycetota bacterium]
MLRAPLSHLRSAPPTAWISGLVCLGLILASLVLHWRAIADVWLVGPDLFHLLEASRVGAERGLGEVLTSKIQPFLNFYRPLTSLSFAVDQMVWDLNAVGFQATNLACFGFCLVAFWLTALRLFGTRRGGAGAIAAVAVFAFMPIAWEVVPFIERRSECMLTGFALLALRAQLSAGKDRAMPIAPAVWSLLAMCSKDSGLALLPVYFVAAMVAAPEGGPLDRALRGARAMVPHVVLSSLFFGMRLVAIGGVGGDENTSLANLVRVPLVVLDMLGMFMVPKAPVDVGLAFGWSLILTVLLAFLALVPWTRAFGLGGTSDSDGGELDATALRAWAVLLPWVLIFVGIYTLRGFITPWYVFAPSAAWCLLVGLLADSLAGQLGRGAWIHRLLAAASLIALASTAWVQGGRSPIFTGDPHVDGISEREQTFFAELERLILESPSGTVIPAPTIDLRYRSDVIKWVAVKEFERPVGVFRDAAEAQQLGTDGLEVVVYYANENER